MKVGKELGRLMPLGLLALMLAGCTLVGPKDNGSSAQIITQIHQLRQLPESSELVLIVNPSAHAKSLGFEHAISIARAVAQPKLTLVGLYEEVTIDDGEPFDRPFVSTAVPNVGKPPAFNAAVDCTGTKFQKSKCRGASAEALDHALIDTQTWHSHAMNTVATWRRGVVADLKAAAAGGATEEAADGEWNLRATLLRAGQVVQALPAQHQCMVLLGGLAVRRPPRDLPVAVLGNTTIVVFGWQGTQRIQEDWKNALGPTTNVIFVPQTVTDIQLLSAVRGCLTNNT